MAILKTFQAKTSASGSNEATYHNSCGSDLMAVRSTTDTNKLQENINNTADWSHFINLLLNVTNFYHVRFLSKLF